MWNLINAILKWRCNSFKSCANTSSVKSQVSQSALWQSMRSRHFFPKMVVNFLIHIFEHRRLLVAFHTVFPVWCGCSDFVRVISCPYSLLKSCYNKMLGILAEISSAHNWILFKLYFSAGGWGRVGWRFWSCVRSRVCMWRGGVTALQQRCICSLNLQLHTQWCCICLNMS